MTKTKTKKIAGGNKNTPKPDKKDSKIAYTIKDKNFPDFQVKKSANAWWMERRKVEDLISAFKIDATNEEACTYAGISLAQLKYFLELHEEFYTVRDACKELIFLRARQAISKNVDDGDYALRFMERKKKAEFSLRTEHTGPDGGPIEITDYEKKLEEAQKYEDGKKGDKKR